MILYIGSNVYRYIIIEYVPEEKNVVVVMRKYSKTQNVQ